MKSPILLGRESFLMRLVPARRVGTLAGSRRRFFPGSERRMEEVRTQSRGVGNMAGKSL